MVKTGDNARFFSFEIANLDTVNGIVMNRAEQVENQ